MTECNLREKEITGIQPNQKSEKIMENLHTELKCDIREICEKEIASSAFAVRFCYVKGILLGFDTRGQGEGWNYPQYAYSVDKLKSEYGITDDDIREVYYYNGIKSD